MITLKKKTTSATGFSGEPYTVTLETAGYWVTHTSNPNDPEVFDELSDALSYFDFLSIPATKVIEVNQSMIDGLLKAEKGECEELEKKDMNLAHKELMAYRAYQRAKLDKNSALTESSKIHGINLLRLKCSYAIITDGNTHITQSDAIADAVKMAIQWSRNDADLIS